MFAVIQTGGKQYKVAKDDIIIVEKLDGEAGGKITFDSVLMHGAAGDVKVGVPLVNCLLYTSPSPRDLSTSRMPSSA